MEKQKVTEFDELADLISHELRTPLCVISNSVYYLNTKLKHTDDKVKKHLAIIQDEVERTNQLITGIIEFSRSRSLAPTLINGINVHSLIKSFLVTLTIPNSIVVTTDFADGEYSLLIDPEQIKKVLFFLIMNAFQAMPHGGQLLIKTRGSENFMEILFIDRGEGIAEKNIDRIFEPFFTTRLKGIGLGLTIASNIIKKHKGSINVESKPASGTTFTVRLPL
jgi:signal transduction histidine kinase